MKLELKLFLLNRHIRYQDKKLSFGEISEKFMKNKQFPMSFKKSNFVKTNYRAREEGVKTYQALYLKTAIVNIDIKIITRHEFKE